MHGVAATAAGRPSARDAVVPSGVLGTLVFIAVEVMLFAGLVSAYIVVRSSVGAPGWPPPDQPRLPVAATAFNTALLLASGVVLRYGRRQATAAPGVPAAVGATLALGAAFVALQGWEWVRLVRFGLTLTSSTYGAFFYLVVGAHALHALGGLAALAWATVRLRRGALTPDALQAVALFWYFVVGLWPVLYVLVYLL
jgi:heme/copper-type cytochrome/quinol oxidase subunit 3